jgi:glycerophosphoryl diester phosphodiesterase
VWCPVPASAGVLLEAGADAVVVDEVPRALELLGPQHARASAGPTVVAGRWTSTA